jgi:transposase
VERQQQYVGIDLHRRRSVIVRMAEDGQVLGVDQVVNDPVELSMAVAKAGPDPEVALESTYGWYWAVDLLQANGAHVHLVHPLGLHWDTRRVKNDIRDSTELANRLRRGDLPEAYIAPPEQRELRELVRYQAKLTALRTSAKAQIHAVMAKEGILPTLDDMFGPGGRQLLDEMPFEGAYAMRVDSLRKLLDVYAAELTVVEAELAACLAEHPGYRAIQAICGVGPIMAAIFRRDRRRLPLPHGAPPVLLGRAHALPPRVRHQGPARPHHQAGQPSGALGRHRGRGPLQGRRPHRPHLHPGRPPTRPHDRPRGRRPQAPHPRLLRPARRTHPRARRGGVRVRTQPRYELVERREPLAHHASEAEVTV